ncbi:MAG: 2-amino-4-hydroxy-6-hydroxymethyldihydropteridine diphosphokinase, partial [Kineosporiaceae bacterium]
MTCGNAAGLDEAPARPVRAVLALGANLGDRAATLQAAVLDLDAFEGVRVLAASPVVETDPVGGPGQPDYLNAVLVVETTLSALDLL